MRLQAILGVALLSLLFPATLAAEAFNEAAVNALSGTIMVQPADGSKPYALQTGSTVQKGDVLTCYDKSWVILKTHRGDQFGLEGDTVVNIDEYYIEGPDRQIRLILQKGTLLFRTGGCNSRQSFFEINTGSVVTSINDTRAILHYDPAKESLHVQYLSGKLTVIDKDNEEKFKTENTENTWTDGKMTATEPEPVDELDVVNFNRFFNDEDPLEAESENLLTNPSSTGESAADLGAGGPKVQEANKDYHEGVTAYDNGDFGAAKSFWESAIALVPSFSQARNSLHQLAQEHPELKIDESQFQFERHDVK